MRRALTRHWPEYLMEAVGLGLFMVSACVVTLLVEHPASPLRAALPAPLLRRGFIGVAMGLTAGVGFRGSLDALRYHVDYAWADQGRLEDTHRLSFGLLF